MKRLAATVWKDPGAIAVVIVVLLIFANLRDVLAFMVAL